MHTVCHTYECLTMSCIRMRLTHASCRACECVMPRMRMVRYVTHRNESWRARVMSHSLSTQHHQRCTHSKQTTHAPHTHQIHITVYTIHTHLHTHHIHTTNAINTTANFLTNSPIVRQQRNVNREISNQNLHAARLSIHVGEPSYHM